VEFVMDNLALEQILLQVFRFFPYQYRSTNVPTSYSFACCSYHKYKRRKPGNFPKSNALSKLLGGGGGALDNKVFSIYLNPQNFLKDNNVPLTHFKWRRRKRNKALNKGITQLLPQKTII
jgi:hypothetical protein